ncbi:MAG TPA: hypothetical protein VI731_12730 [Bacteroidia bacterium]|nr:hypothetical protein [Bacteroidia bacterium]
MKGRLFNLPGILPVQLLPGFLTLIFLPTLSAQNLEKIGKKDMVTISGGLNFNTIFYDAQGMEERRDPLTWFMSGNVNVTLLDVSLPFTFTYTNNRGTYSQPFNMQSVHPKYKWIQGHFGITSMSFSPYTLNGHVFAGGGIELTPNGFYFGAMYGRLKKAVEPNIIDNSYEGISYRRTGAALKLGFDKDGRTLAVSWLTAKDDIASLLFVPADADLTPQQNSAIGLSGKIRLWEKISAEGEFGWSGLTRNMQAEAISTEFSGIEKWLLPTKTTTQFFKAWKGSLTYATKLFSIAVKHEHVDPDYQTFGAYYFANDLENWTLAPSFRLLKGKLSVGLNTGIQRNNLDQTKLSTAHRWVGSVNVSASPVKWLMLTAAYSNFTSYTNRRPQTDPFWQPSPTDTLSFYQVAQQANGNAVISFGSKNVKHSISVLTNFQVSRQQQSTSVQPGMHVMSENLSWTIQLVPRHISVSALGNYTVTETGIIRTVFFGPGMQLSRSKESWRLAAGSIYNRSIANGDLAAQVFSHRASCGFTPKMKSKKYGRPSASCNAVFVQKLPALATENTTGELTVTVNLAYGF